MALTSLDGTVFDYLPALIAGGLRLDGNSYAAFQALPGSAAVAWAILIAAGVSQAVGRSAILFLNRVRPSHFLQTLLVTALSLAAGLAVWLVSTWAVTHFLFAVKLPLGTVARTLGLACLPLVFAFLAAMPYFGPSLFALLAVWCLLGMATGIAALSSLSFVEALVAAALGWVAWQGLERTVGRPIVALGKRLEQRAAGTELTTDLIGLAGLLEDEAAALQEEIVEEALAEAAEDEGANSARPAKKDAHEPA